MIKNVETVVRPSVNWLVPRASWRLSFHSLLLFSTILLVIFTAESHFPHGTGCPISISSAYVNANLPVAVAAHNFAPCDEHWQKQSDSHSYKRPLRHLHRRRLTRTEALDTPLPNAFPPIPTSTRPGGCFCLNVKDATHYCMTCLRVRAGPGFVCHWNCRV